MLRILTPTPVCVDDFDDAPTHPIPTDIATKKKGESRRTQGFVKAEDKCLCEAWLATTQDCINGAQQKGKVYWAKVLQQYNETRMHPPYHITGPRTEESLRKRWSYIKQETSKFCSAAEHAINNPVSGTDVLTVVPRALQKFRATHKKGFHMDEHEESCRTSPWPPAPKIYLSYDVLAHESFRKSTLSAQ
ncbi:uncharacterized protein [Lolium perenne]|uniref:uncharacterized protein n=1 Tax=Lolium perenne TaxID=4522 RepID=UPI003A99DC81